MGEMLGSELIDDLEAQAFDLCAEELQAFDSDTLANDLFWASYCDPDSTCGFCSCSEIISAPEAAEAL